MNLLRGLTQKHCVSSYKLPATAIFRHNVTITLYDSTIIEV